MANMGMLLKEGFAFVHGMTVASVIFCLSKRENFMATHVEEVSEAAARVKEDVERIVQGFDLQVITKRIEEFGRDNPVGLALTALTLGVAAGMLMRNSVKKVA
jgi:hypothetical protein